MIRDRNPNFVVLADGSVRNGYTLKLMNHASAARDFYLSIDGVRPGEGQRHRSRRRLASGPALRRSGQGARRARPG
ncbi:MAG: FixG Ig-like domain-containing protein [Rhizomicrobium sp.]